jgi:hypothetical protein
MTCLPYSKSRPMVATQTIEIKLPYQGLITAALVAISATPPALFSCTLR